MTRFITFLLAVGATIFRGYLLSVFWVWFVMSQIPNAPHLGVVACIGLSYFIGLLSGPDYSFPEYKASEDEQAAFRFYQVIFTYVWLGVCWLFGYVIHLFM